MAALRYFREREWERISTIQKWIFVLVLVHENNATLPLRIRDFIRTQRHVNLCLSFCFTIFSVIMFHETKCYFLTSKCVWRLGFAGPAGQIPSWIKGDIEGEGKGDSGMEGEAEGKRGGREMEIWSTLRNPTYANSTASNIKRDGKWNGCV